MIESRPHILFFRETDRNTRPASHSVKARCKLRATYKMVKSSAYHTTSETHVHHAFSTEKILYSLFFARNDSSSLALVSSQQDLSSFEYL